MDEWPIYYDRQGRTVDMMTWARAFEAGNRVACTEVGEVTVSTVWLGIDHRFGVGPPLIFETIGVRRLERPVPGALFDRSRGPGRA